MPVGRGGIAGGALPILAALAPFLLYGASFGSADGGAGWLIRIVVVVQVTAAVWLIARNLPLGSRGILAVATAAATEAGFRMGLPVRPASLVVGGFCHAAAYAGLLYWFVTSLRPGGEPVVTGFARRIRKAMPDQVIVYTRLVTIAWAVFFAVQLAASAGLLAIASVAVWSSFVNRWNLPLVAAMLLTEFGCRLLLFRRQPHTGLIATLMGLRHIRGPSGGNLSGSSR